MIRSRCDTRESAFTILELVIVVVIVGILATLGMTQYSLVIERSRGAEAKAIMSQLRKLCSEIYAWNQNTSDCDNAHLNINDTNTDMIPSKCRPSNYFKYAVVRGASNVSFVATRCEQGENGREPGIPVGSNRNFTLITDYSTGGTDQWIDPFGY